MTSICPFVCLIVYFIVYLIVSLVSHINQREAYAQPLSSQSIDLKPMNAEVTVNLNHELAPSPTMSDDRRFRRVISAREAIKRLNDSKLDSSVSSKTSLYTVRSCGSATLPRTRLLDARDLAPLYHWRHAEGALHVPWRRFTRARRSGVLLNADELTQRLQTLGICSRDHVIIYGDWERGWGEEARMLWLLEYAGHEHVSVIGGGWRAWLAASGETARGANPSVVPSDWSPRWRAEVRVETSEVSSLLARGVRSLDARSRREYDGETPYGSPIGGH